MKALEEKYLASKYKSAYLERIIQMESYVSNYDEAYEDLLYAGFPATKTDIERYKKDLPDIKSSPVADSATPF